MKVYVVSGVEKDKSFEKTYKSNERDKAYGFYNNKIGCMRKKNGGEIELQEIDGEKVKTLEQMVINKK